jgi:hypothetical protein
MTTEQRIEWNYYEHEWCVIWPDRNDYPRADLDALVAAGKLERVDEATVFCPEGHTWWVSSPANLPAYRHCNQCEDPGDPEDYSVKVEVRWLLSNEWKAALQRNVRECEHCGGTGRIFPPAPEVQP